MKSYNLLKQSSLLLVISLAGMLVGCGGSSNSNSSATPAAPGPAVIMKDNGVQTAVPDYQITVSPSGTASFTSEILGQPATLQTGSVALSAGLTSKFYQDLASATSLSKLPPYTGAASSQSRFLYLKYQNEQAELLGTNNTQAQALADDCTAIAQALGLPTDAITP
jgi:hypothetical protein